jgi:Lar family restriction alleviation protein
MRALLPCPFCGSTEVSLSHTVQGACWVVCETEACGAIGPTKPTPAEAASAWNTRVIAEAGNACVAQPEDPPAAGPPGTVLPVEMESRLVGDIAGFRANEVELREERDPTRLCLGRAIETIAGDLILVQVSGTIVGGFAWVYPKRRPLPPERTS